MIRKAPLSSENITLFSRIKILSRVYENPINPYENVEQHIFCELEKS